jgi:hypothetical protein
MTWYSGLCCSVYMMGMRANSKATQRDTVLAGRVFGCLYAHGRQQKSGRETLWACAGVKTRQWGGPGACRGTRAGCIEQVHGEAEFSRGRSHVRTRTRTSQDNVCIPAAVGAGGAGDGLVGPVAAQVWKHCGFAGCELDRILGHAMWRRLCRACGLRRKQTATATCHPAQHRARPAFCTAVAQLPDCDRLAHHCSPLAHCHR